MIVFISSFISPHTQPLCLALKNMRGGVKFISLSPITQERKELGYEGAMADIEIIDYKDNQQKCDDLIFSADVVIFSHFRVELLKKRCDAGKLTFLYTERIFKKGVLKFLDTRLYKQLIFNIKNRNNNVYLLSIGNKCVSDFKFLGFNKNKIFSFGYFPKTFYYDEQDLIRNNPQVEMLWVGRFVGFKRLQFALKTIRRVYSIQRGFHLTVIGDGKKFKNAQKYINKYNLPITLKGKQPQSKVREAMLKSDIMLCTSSGGEGWGAVINEAMNCGCCVVCSEAAGGSALLKDGNNGFIFKTKNEFLEKLLYALNNLEWRLFAGKNAYRTITEIWNEDFAAGELIELIKELESSKLLSSKKILNPTNR